MPTTRANYLVQRDSFCGEPKVHLYIGADRHVASFTLEQLEHVLNAHNMLAGAFCRATGKEIFDVQ